MRYMSVFVFSYASFPAENREKFDRVYVPIFIDEGVP